LENQVPDSKFADGCPEPGTLKQLLLGRLPGAEADSIGKHVDVCDSCADLIARFDSEDGLLTILSGNSDIARQSSTQTLAEYGTAELLDSPSAAGDLGRLGPYRILRELGRGGMGVVYVAEDTRLHRQVALKVMHARAAASSQYQVRFEREVDALARLSHPNIVQVYEAGRHKAIPYLAMEYVPSGTLAQYLQGRPLPPQAAAELLATLADAIHFAHLQGVIHRDLKPSNILLSHNEGDSLATNIHSARDRVSIPELRLPKIADFGLARHAEQEAMTLTGDLLGTPSYMAPEMTRGGTSGAKDSEAVDVYGLGAILYELLTGRPPFRGESVPDTFEQVRNLDPVSVRQLQPKVPRDLETICLKCLQKEPHKRYLTANALGDDLRRFLEGRTILARPAGPVERLTKWVRRKPAWAAAVGVLMLASLTLVVVGLRYEGRLRQSVIDAETSAAEARRERENAQASYREARAAMEKILGRVTEPRRGNLPRVRELRQEQQEDALAFYLKVAEQSTGSEPEMRYDAAQARLQASLMQIRLGRPGITENLQRAMDLLKVLLDEFPDEARYRRAYSDCLFQKGVVEETEKKSEYFERSRHESERLHAANPKAQEYRNDLSRVLHMQATIAQAKGDHELAQKHYRQAIAISETMLAEQPNWRELQLSIAQTKVNLILSLQNSKHTFAELEPEANAVMKILEVLAREDTNDPTALMALGSMRANWTYMLIVVGKADEALKGLGEVIEELEAFLVREPSWLEARSTLLSVRGTRAIVHDRKGRYAEAVKDYRRVVDLAPSPRDRKSLRTELNSLLILARDYHSALVEAERSAAEGLPMYSIHMVERHLKTCAALANFSIWKYRPYRTRAIQVARVEMERARAKESTEQWQAWLKTLRATKELKDLFACPELQAVLK